MKKIYSLTFLLLSLIMVKMNAQNSTDIFSYKVGEYELILLAESQQQGKKEILIGATPEMIGKYIPDGTFPNAMNAFLLKTPECNILIDTGVGRKLIDNLSAVGITPEEIDIILITHMHGDHIGGMLKDGTIVFPNAQVYLSQPEYDYWMSDGAMNTAAENKKGGFRLPREVVSKYGDRLHLFQPSLYNGNKNALLPGISPIAAYGHTPGHTSYLLESGNEKLLIWGDLTHAIAIQMPLPEIAVTYDVNPEDAVRSRKEILEYVSKQAIPIAGMHIAYPAMGVVKQAVTGYEFIPASK